ncbi:50S ribosomal protein L11 methyltransferase [Kiloniella spongiae]|uniref:50S ribosomal protein L11 methyltransferase n=1 Tax=Kiloniella spongiae TaxID=1489064 RepID=A0A0H2N082_9PROT|nr:50S ribosomal protein L11 methyltransferase [Kiloniella spongiae]KLN62320.1 50S ribosomal protein L11 methyltransferase [Kiloniella spongiae]
MTPISDPKNFIVQNTRPAGTPLLGNKIELYLASKDLPLWQLGEEELDNLQLPTPFWAFAWAGGQALAQYILDNPNIVHGKNVLDFACGCGIEAIAAKMAGAKTVLAADIDPFAIAATELNAELNKITLATTTENLVGKDNQGWDVILAGDVCYEGPMAKEITSWLWQLSTVGTIVLMGDPGRTYLPKSGLRKLIAYSVQTSSALEDTDVRNACVWKFTEN